MRWLPPTHDYRGREHLLDLGGWQVRRLPAADPKFDYFARRGFLHLQLWHPCAGVSVLTPSRMTMYAYEVCPLAGQMCSVGTPEALRLLLWRGLCLETPTPPEVRALQVWFVKAPGRAASARRSEHERSLAGDAA